MTTYNTPNYNEQGGARQVIGGELAIADGGELTVASGGDITVASGGDLNLAAGSLVKVGGVTLLTGRAVTAGAVAVVADALAIPVTHQVVSKTTGDDAEALTLANGANGQDLVIVLAVDGGGTGTLTPTTKTGFATIVFADAGDQVALRFIDATVGWVILGATGVAAPPAITI